MIVVLASRNDQAARDFTARHSSLDVRLLTPEDFCRAGWRSYRSNPDDSVAVLGEQHVSVRQISGVLTCLATVGDWEVPETHEEDRTYVSEELTAFLGWWLSSLPCPVLNSPAPPFLSSPCWPGERWTLLARRLGIPAQATHRSAKLGPQSFDPPVDRLGDSEGGLSISVIGNRCVGQIVANSMGCHYALRLAEELGVSMLVARFMRSDGGLRLVGADPWVDLTDDMVGEAVVDYLLTAKGSPT